MGLQPEINAKDGGPALNGRLFGVTRKDSLTKSKSLLPCSKPSY